jgi:ribosome-binding factor A
MAGHKIAQLQSKIHAYISEIIFSEVDNELASQASISEVQLSGDGSIATIFVNFHQNKQNSLDALRRASGFIRARLASKLSTRRTPQLIFKLDDQLDKINHIEELIKENN